jgi:hypothetical protein
VGVGVGVGVGVVAVGMGAAGVVAAAFVHPASSVSKHLVTSFFPTFSESKP